MTDPRLLKLRDLGYQVNHDGPSGVVSVSGFGVALSFDLAAGQPIVASLLDAKAHAVRKAQHERARSPREGALDGL